MGSLSNMNAETSIRLSIKSYVDYHNKSYNILRDCINVWSDNQVYSNPNFVWTISYNDVGTKEYIVTMDRSFYYKYFAKERPYISVF